MKWMHTGKLSISVWATNSGGFGPQCPAWPGKHDTPGGSRETSLLSWWRNQAHFKPLCSCSQLLSSSQPSLWLMPISLLCNVE